MDMDKCWLDVDKSIGSGNIDLNLIFDENRTEENRSAKIQIKSPDGKIVKEVTVVQRGFDIVYKNKEVSKVFYKEGCDEDTEKAEPYTYVVPAGRYKSTESQVAADDQAWDDIRRNGQEQANINGVCKTTKWYSNAMSGVYTRQCPGNQIGSEVSYSIEAGREYSLKSQEDADAKAKAIMDVEGQEKANSEGTCVDPVYYNERKEKTLAKNDCNPDTEEGTEVTMVVEAGEIQSNVSEAEANRIAQEKLDREAQDYANAHGTCVTVKWYNEARSLDWQRGDCDPDTEEGTIVTRSVEAGKYFSTISQEDANKKADDFLRDGIEEYAIQYGACKTVKWYNTEITGEFTKEGCMADEEGSKHSYTIDAGRFHSTESPEDAQRKAEEALATEGQKNANDNGVCSRVVWYNSELKALIQRDDCGVGGVGKFYEYVVDAGKYASRVNQEDADKQAYDEILVSGEIGEDGVLSEDAVIQPDAQAIVNTEAECEMDPNYTTGKASKEFTTECSDSENGSVVVVTEADMKDIEGSGWPFDKKENGEYYIPSEQDLANADALEAINQYGQQVANEKGECTPKPVYRGSYSTPEKVYKNDCLEGGVPDGIIVTSEDLKDIPESGYPFETYDQIESNQLAEAAVNEYKQQIANEKCVCTYTGKYKAEFQKLNCPATDEDGNELIGGWLAIDQDMVEGGPFISHENQDAANDLAEAAVNAQGQAIADRDGTCNQKTKYEAVVTRTYTPQCDGCTRSDDVNVTSTEVNGSVVFSYKSPEDAEVLANAVLDEVIAGEGITKGQWAANKKATCVAYELSDEECEWVLDDSVAENPFCRDGESWIVQKNITPCGMNPTREIKGGDKTCTWYGQATMTGNKLDCEGGENAGTEVTIDQDDLEGYASDYPFASIVDQVAANLIAEKAMEDHGQTVINAKGGCNDCFEVELKTFYKSDCGTCKHDPVGKFANVSDVLGANKGFCMPEFNSQEEAQAEYERLGQILADKYSTGCTDVDLEAKWEDVLVDGSAVLECQNGKPMRKQQQTNSCYGGTETERWIADTSGELICSVTPPVKSWEVTAACADNGVGSTVTVTSDMLEGHPFTVEGSDAYNSEEEMMAAAIALQDAAFAAQGAEVAKTVDGYQCTWTGQASASFTATTCQTCYDPVATNVTLAQTGYSGTDIQSNKSKADADQKALAKLTEVQSSTGKSLGQSYIDKNPQCREKDRTAAWSDTGRTQCSGCNSQKQQKDTNACSSTYNQTRWINGGGRDCTENGEWNIDYSDTHCSGTTLYYAANNTCGAYDRYYDVAEYNSYECGYEPPCEEACIGITYECHSSGDGRSRRVGTYRCDGGNCYPDGTEWGYTDGKCGYSSCVESWSQVSNSCTCDSGTSKVLWREKCSGDEDYRDGGSCCSAEITVQCSCGECGPSSAVGKSSGHDTQAEADAAARNNADCTCNQLYTGSGYSTATKTNCPSGYEGLRVEYRTTATSCESAEAARLAAQAKAESGAQANANSASTSAGCRSVNNEGTGIVYISCATGLVVNIQGSTFSNGDRYEFQASPGSYVISPSSCHCQGVSVGCSGSVTLNIPAGGSDSDTLSVSGSCY